MAKDVKIRITAKDATKAALGGVKRNLRQLGRVAGRVTGGIRRAFMSLGRGIRNATLAIGAGITAIGVASVKAAADAEETRSKFQAVFKEVAGDAHQWAVSFGKSVNRATIDIKKMLSGVQDLFVPLGFSRKEASAFSKSVAQLAVDLASFNNVADDVALRDIQSALVGNSETVRKYGIILTEVNIAQEAVNLGMAETTKEVSNQAKVMARLSLITKGSADAQGDAVRTSKSFTNILKGLGAAFKTLKIEIGEQLLAGLNLANNFSDLTSRVAAFTAKLRESGAIKEFAQNALTALKPVRELMTALFEGGDKRTAAIEKIKAVGTDFGASIITVLMASAERFGAKIAIGMVKAPLHLGSGIGAVMAGASAKGGGETLQRRVRQTNSAVTSARIVAGASTFGFSEVLIAQGRLLINAMNENKKAVVGLKDREG